MLIFMQISGFRRVKGATLALLAIGCGLLFWHILRQKEIALSVFASVVVACVYYAAVPLYRENESMMGGLPQANHGYTSGFAVLLVGNLVACWAFLISSKELLYAGGFLVLLGTGLMILANQVLFRHVIRRGLTSQH